MAIQESRLADELMAAGLPLAVLRVAGTQPGYQRPDGFVRCVWSRAISLAEDAQAAAIVTAHDGSPTLFERLRDADVPRQLLAAVVLRASTQFAGLTVNQRNQIQNVIDLAATRILSQI